MARGEEAAAVQAQSTVNAGDLEATKAALVDDKPDAKPADAKGGKGKMWQLFGEEMNTLINELNEVLAA